MPLLLDAVVIYVLGVIFSIFGQCLISKVNVSEFDFNAWISFVLNSFASNFYIPLLVVLLQKYINTSKGKHNFKITPPITSVDEYERELEIRLSKERYKQKKIIIIVDDLDRLTPNKIVEALDAIKAFVGYPNFVFIVPFDDTILREAIKQEKTSFVYNEHLTIESDLFLDKLFQYRISLPNVIQSNIPQYAIEASQKDAADLVELCGKENFDLICKEILIHKKVVTPRQAKKIINTFANNLLLGYRRECNGVAEGVFTSLCGKRFLAKISVLQSDFPSFYSNMFIDNTIIDEFLRLTNNEKNDQKPSELLMPYFVEKDNGYILNKTGESLSMFLHRTASITVENIARFLYLNDDRLSELFGNEFSLAVRDGLSSGAYHLVREKLEANLDKDISDLLYEVLSNSDPIEFEFCCIGIINVSDMDVVKNDIRLLSLLNERLISVFVSNDIIPAKNLNFENVINIFKLHNDFDGIDRLITNQFKNEEDDLVKKLSVFFENEEHLSVNVKFYIKELISARCSTEKSSLNFKDLFNIESLDIDVYFENYLSDLDMFKRLFDYIVTEENYDETDSTVAAFIKLYNKHSRSNCADKVLEIVSSNLANTEFAELLIHHMVEHTDKLSGAKVIISASYKLMKASNDDISDSVNLWLSKVNWKIIPGRSETVDKYLRENLISGYIDDMLLNVSEKKQVKFIPETIAQLHMELLEENVSVSTIGKLQKQYSADQNAELFEKLKTVFLYSNDDDNILSFGTNLLKVLAQDDKNETYITDLAEYIYSQNSRYPNYMLEKIHKLSEFKQAISKNTIQKFISWANSYISSYPMNSCVIYDIFKYDIVKAEYATHGDKVMTYVTEDTLVMSLAILRILRPEFKTETNQLKTYKNFLIKYLSNQYCRKSIIKDIVDYFSKIGEVDEFICEVAKYADILDESIAAITKFTEKNTHDEDVKMVKKILSTIESQFIDNVNKICFGWLGAEYSLIIIELLESVDDSISVIYGINLIKLSNEMGDISSSLKVKLISTLLEICDDVMLPEIIPESEKIGRLSKNLEKRQLGTALYNTFRNTTNNSIKKRLASLVKLTGVRSSFETDEKRAKRDFSEDEGKLLKELLKRNK